MDFSTLQSDSVIAAQIDGLAQDLPIYTLGIFPFFEHASSLVRVEVLNIFEKYMIPLGGKLLPHLPSTIIALLPGLEEETGEHFESCASLLDKIQSRIGKSEFFEALWGSLLANSGHRISCVNYLGRIIPKTASGAEVAHFCVVNMTLISSACAAALSDPHILTVRKILDFCIAHFPLNASSIEGKDQLPIVQSILLTLLRRDMSLSRRVFTFLNGDQSSSNHNHGASGPSTGAAAACFALQGIARDKDDPLGDGLNRALKVLVFLNDRAELFDPIVSKMVVDLIEAAPTHFERGTDAVKRVPGEFPANFLEMGAVNFGDSNWGLALGIFSNAPKQKRFAKLCAKGSPHLKTTSS